MAAHQTQKGKRLFGFMSFTKKARSFGARTLSLFFALDYGK